MTEQSQHPQVFHLLQADALDIHRSPTGEVGRVFAGEGLEAVWVAKQQEVIDTAWFSQPTVDLLLIVQGQLWVEFEQAVLLAPLALSPGDLLVLPPHTRCRAYRWPRERQEASIFLAVYPTGDDRATHEQDRITFLPLRCLHQQKVMVSLTPQPVRQQ